MMAAVRNFFGFKPSRPITHNDVLPASRDPEIEKKIRQASAKLAGELLANGRKSWEIRQELAGNVIKIVSGEKNDITSGVP